MSTEVTRGEMNDIIAKFASENTQYRNALLDDPREVLARQMGCDLPDWLSIQVVQDSADTLYLVLPHTPDEELSDADLESVAGGGKSSNNTYTCNNAKGVGTHVEINAEFGF